MRIWSKLLFLAALLLASCASVPPLPEASEPVVALMAQRLELAHDVAWAKWADGLPVRDREQEALVLEKLSAQAESAEIEPLLIVRFMRAQFEASCLEQETWIQQWQTGKSPAPEGPPPNLEALRAKLTHLSRYLIAEWAAAPMTPGASARQRLLKSVINPRSATLAASGF